MQKEPNKRVIKWNSIGSRRWIIVGMVLAVVFGCVSNRSDSLREIHEELKEGLRLPTEIYGGYYSFTKPVVYSIYKEERLDNFIIDSDSRLHLIDISELHHGLPFHVYFDRNAIWNVLSKIKISMQHKNEGCFYVACEDPSNPSIVEFLQVKTTSRSDFNSIVLLEVFSDGKIAVEEFGEIKLYKAYDDPSLLEDISEVLIRNNTSAVFLRGADDVLVGDFLKALGYLAIYTDADIYFCGEKE